MSWGERSCKKPCREPEQCYPGTCNANCSGYIWDGKTAVDSYILRGKLLKDRFEFETAGTNKRKRRKKRKRS